MIDSAEIGASRDLLHLLRRSMMPWGHWDNAADLLALRLAAGQLMVRKSESKRDRAFEPLLADFAANGIGEFGKLLDDAAVGEIVSFLTAQPGFAGHHFTSSNRVERPFAELALSERYCAYRPDTILRAPHLLALANRPEIVDFVERAMGCVPTLYSLSACWSFPFDGEPWPKHSQHFHRDDDDFRFFTFFCYLTDVEGPGDGPNQVVAGTHRAAAMRAIGLEEEATKALSVQFPEPFDLVPNLLGDRIRSTLGPPRDVLHRRYARAASRAAAQATSATYILGALRAWPEFQFQRRRSAQRTGAAIRTRESHRRHQARAFYKSHVCSEITLI